MMCTTTRALGFHEGWEFGIQNDKVYAVAASCAAAQAWAIEDPARKALAIAHVQKAPVSSCSCIVVLVVLTALPLTQHLPLSASECLQFHSYSYALSYYSSPHPTPAAQVHGDNFLAWVRRAMTR